MSTVWVIEKRREGEPSAAQALMGDFGVRAIASLDSFEKLLRLNSRHRPQVVVVDVEDAARPMIELCALMSRLLPDAGLLMLHGISHPEAQVALQGRVARCAKPNEGLVLSTLIDSLLQMRRIGASLVRYRDVALDFERFQCRIAEDESTQQSLPLKEAQLLKLLLEKPGVCLTRDEIAMAIWDGVKVASRTIDSHVSRLRKRLAGAEVTIESVYGGGYVLR